MPHEELDQILDYLKALANESRLKLLGLLADHERSVGELAEILELKEPTISHHLAKLLELGLITLRPEGTTHFYRLNREQLQRLGQEVFTVEKVTSLADELEVDARERKVLHTFLEGERLTKIPDTRKKRDVILRWLATQFEEDVRYPESQVNEIIKRHHPDTATLRRELIGAGLMQRENGIYWRC